MENIEQEKRIVPDVLYHYTSLESLLAILDGIDVEAEKVCFRATHAAYLNDMTEGKLLPNALNQLGVSGHKVNVLQSCIGFPFVLSLTELNDNLYMWNSYAKQGMGCAIGLKTGILQQEFKEKLYQCCYVSEDEICERLRSQVEELNNESDSMELARVLQKELFYYKTSAFSSEQEWRLVLLGKEEGCKLGSNVITPFTCAEISTAALTSITFGPKVDYERNSFAVERLMKSKIRSEIKVEMRRSQIPLI